MERKFDNCYEYWRYESEKVNEDMNKKIRRKINNYYELKRLYFSEEDYGDFE